MVDGEVVEEYESDYEINFDLPERYTELEGIVTFRGDNFRSGAAYGTAAVSSKTLTKAWSKSTSGLSPIPTASIGPAAAGRVSRSSSSGPMQRART